MQLSTLIDTKALNALKETKKAVSRDRSLSEFCSDFKVTTDNAFWQEMDLVKSATSEFLLVLNKKYFKFMIVSRRKTFAAHIHQLLQDGYSCVLFRKGEKMRVITTEYWSRDYEYLRGINKSNIEYGPSYGEMCVLRENQRLKRSFGEACKPIGKGGKKHSKRGWKDVFSQTRAELRQEAYEKQLFRVRNSVNEILSTVYGD